MAKRSLLPFLEACMRLPRLIRFWPAIILPLVTTLTVFLYVRWVVSDLENDTGEEPVRQSRQALIDRAIQRGLIDRYEVDSHGCHCWVGSAFRADQPEDWFNAVTQLWQISFDGTDHPAKVVILYARDGRVLARYDRENGLTIVAP
jgi:hypothetical protein